jgi:hypothetical protein
MDLAELNTPNCQGLSIIIVTHNSEKSINLKTAVEMNNFSCNML